MSKDVILVILVLLTYWESARADLQIKSLFDNDTTEDDYVYETHSKSVWSYRSDHEDPIIQGREGFYPENSTISVDPLRIDNLNVTAARLALPVVTRLDEKARQWVFEYDLDTGVYSQWKNDTDDLIRITEFIRNLICFIGNSPDSTNTEDLNLAKRVIENFITRIMGFMNDIDKNNPANYKEFTPYGRWIILYIKHVNCMFAYYLLSPMTDYKYLVANKIIHITTIARRHYGTALGDEYLMHKQLVIGPYMLANYFMFKLDEVEKYDLYQKFMTEPINRQRRLETGQHMDHTFIVFGRPNYGYKRCNECTFWFYAFIKNIYYVPNFCDIASESDRYVFHPTVHASSPDSEAIQFDNIFRSKVEKDAPLGIRVMPFGRFIRYFTETTKFSVRMQHAKFVYYDKAFYKADPFAHWVHYKVQFRRPLTNMIPQLLYKDGLIMPLLADHETLVKFNYYGVTRQTDALKLCNMRWCQTSNSDSIFGLVNRFSSSYVFVNSDFKKGYAYHVYNAPSVGNYRVSEYITMDDVRHVIIIDLFIDNTANQQTYEYNGVNRTTIVIEPKTMAYISTVWYLDTNVGKIITADTNYTGIVGTRNHDDIKRLENGWMLYEQDEAMYYIPQEWTVESHRVIVNAPLTINADNSTEIPFVFDKRTNQYKNELKTVHKN